MRHSIKPFLAIEINDRASEMEKQGIDVVRFSLGEPDFKSPKVVKNACIRAIRQDITRYEHSQGMIELRQAIAHHYRKKYRVKIGPEQILITPGTSQALFLIFSVLLKKGDRVIVPNPHYPADTNFVEYSGGEVIPHPLSEETGFHWDLSLLKKQISPKIKAIFVTSPANPTGALTTADEYRFMARTGHFIIADEIYHGLTYKGEEHTALEFTDKCFVVNGFSKAYAMTGYRLGYVIAPKKYLEAMRLIQQNFYISVTSFVQAAGVAAITQAQEDVHRMRVEFEKRRSVMLTGLKELGFPINYVPEGAFFIMANARHLSRNSLWLAGDILKKAHVAVTPGEDFGSQTRGYLRFSYATGIPRILEGLKRLKGYLSSHFVCQKL